MKPARSSSSSGSARARPGSAGRLTPARLSPGDVLRVGAAGLRTRPARVLLSALGIAIGIATMVVGARHLVVAPGRAADRTLDRLGTNLLTVAPARTSSAGPGCPRSRPRWSGGSDRSRRRGATGDATAPVYRNDRVPAAQTGGIAGPRRRARPARHARRSGYGTGTWLNAATAAIRRWCSARGGRAARRRGPGGQVWIGGRWFTVIGILEPSPLAAEHRLLRPGRLGRPPASSWASTATRRPSTPVGRAVRRRGAGRCCRSTANPREPEEVERQPPVGRCSPPRRPPTGAFTGLLLGLGAVALLVGGVGVANTMVISVLERRREIGLRRSLGATRGQIADPVPRRVAAAAVLGGAAGRGPRRRPSPTASPPGGDWPAVLPAWALGGGLAATLLVGTVAGIYPAMRAAKMSPTLALSTT